MTQLPHDFTLTAPVCYIGTCPFENGGVEFVLVGSVRAHCGHVRSLRQPLTPEERLAAGGGGDDDMRVLHCGPDGVDRLDVDLQALAHLPCAVVGRFGTPRPDPPPPYGPHEQQRLELQAGLLAGAKDRKSVV